MELDEKIELAAKWISDSNNLVIFTGAGISTHSGLPDYRGPDGVWTRRDKNLPPPKSLPWDQVKPNAAHYAIIELLKIGKLNYVISQNVDGLHAKSGIPFEMLAELHGNRYFMKCLGCNTKFTYEEVGWDKSIWGNGYRTDKVHRGQPNCPKCNDRLISSIVNFGDPLPSDELEEAINRSIRSDVFFVIGSSLVVYPAADLPLYAKKNGAKLIILNRGEIPLIFNPDLRFHEDIIDVLPQIIEKLKEIEEKD
ncbi:MAG: NAD-dependent protein deacylase [Promethearchaeota archaeon]|nr:MAG: NAD-dependent protein deacylase [Candidatus Lokiarchaeota archaeon]